MATTKQDEAMVGGDDVVLGDVNIDHAQTQVWMVKIPKPLHEAWIKATPDTDLGYILRDNVTNKVLSQQ